jgi:urea transport system permease protein
MSNLVLPYNRLAIIAFAMLVLGGVALLIARRGSACSSAA